MRRQSELRTVPRQEAGIEKRESAKSGAHETLPVRTFERGILSTLSEMERMMEEAFHRPMFGMSTLPFRHLFHELGSFGEITPYVDIFEEKGEVVVKAELPGMKRDDINVQLVGNTMIISGEKEADNRVERKDYLRVERSYGSFNRTLNLPEGVDAEHVKASFKDGVLEVRLRRTGSKGSTRQIKVE